MLIFFNGFAMDKQVVAHFTDAASAIVISPTQQQDLSTLQKLLEKKAADEPINVVAWSMGVLVASRFFHDFPQPLQQAVAINGTPLGIDDAMGIAKRAFLRTAQRWSPSVRAQFLAQVFAAPLPESIGEKLAQTVNAHLSQEQQGLLQLIQTAEQLPPLQNIWQQALIGEKDKIVSPAAQQRYWQAHDVPMRFLPYGHYLFSAFDSFQALLDYAKKA